MLGALSGVPPLVRADGVPAYSLPTRELSVKISVSIVCVANHTWPYPATGTIFDLTASSTARAAAVSLPLDHLARNKACPTCGAPPDMLRVTIEE